jgi:hypothetical protein
MPKKKPQSVDSTKSQAKAPAKKTRATPKSDTKATTAKSESMTYSRVTNSVIDRIRSMVSEPANTFTTPPLTSPMNKRVAPANSTKKPSANPSIPVPHPSQTPTETRVGNSVIHHGNATDSVIDRIRSMVSEPVNAPAVPPSVTPAKSPKKKRVAPAKSTKKPSANATIQRHSLPSAPAEAGAVVTQPAVDSVPPYTSQPIKPSPDSYEIPFDVDAYLREKEETLKPQLNRVREQLLSPSSRGWILVNMGGVRMSRFKLKRGMHLYWQVPEEIGQMMRGDHIFLWQIGIHGGMIGHGYLADLPTRFSHLKQPQIEHNLKSPGTNSHVVGVRVVSAHQRLTKEVMKTMPIINTIRPPSERLPHKQPLTTEQTFALLELWYM